MINRLLEIIDRYQKTIGVTILFIYPPIDALRDAMHHAQGEFGIWFHVARTIAFYIPMTFILAITTQGLDNRENICILIMICGVITWIGAFVIY